MWLPGKGTSEGPISPIENDCHFDGHVHQEGMLQVERQFPLMICSCYCKSDPVSIHDNVLGKHDNPIVHLQLYPFRLRKK